MINIFKKQDGMTIVGVQACKEEVTHSPAFMM